jgi:hypothetical protein
MLEEEHVNVQVEYLMMETVYKVVQVDLQLSLLNVKNVTQIVNNAVKKSNIVHHASQDSN